MLHSFDCRVIMPESGMEFAFIDYRIVELIGSVLVFLMQVRCKDGGVQGR